MKGPSYCYSYWCMPCVWSPSWRPTRVFNWGLGNYPCWIPTKLWIDIVNPFGEKPPTTSVCCWLKTINPIRTVRHRPCGNLPTTQYKLILISRSIISTANVILWPPTNFLLPKVQPRAAIRRQFVQTYYNKLPLVNWQSNKPFDMWIWEDVPMPFWKWPCVWRNDVVDIQPAIMGLLPTQCFLRKWELDLRVICLFRRHDDKKRKERVDIIVNMPTMYWIPVFKPMFNTIWNTMEYSHEWNWTEQQSTSPQEHPQKGGRWSARWDNTLIDNCNEMYFPTVHPPVSPWTIAKLWQGWGQQHRGLRWRIGTWLRWVNGLYQHMERIVYVALFAFLLLLIMSFFFLLR